MIRRQSLKDYLHHGMHAPGIYPVPPGVLMTLTLRVVGPVDEPITVMRKLSKQFLGLKKAKDAFERALMGEAVSVDLVIDDLPTFVVELAAFNVELTARN